MIAGIIFLAIAVYCVGKFLSNKQKEESRLAAKKAYADEINEMSEQIRKGKTVYSNRSRTC